MKNFMETYFTYFLKPSLMISCFASNTNYLVNEKFNNTASFLITYSIMLIKPIFFIILYVVFICKIELKTASQNFIAFLIVLLIYFGFPVKEYSDSLKYDELSRFFEGKDYFIDDYMQNHFVANIVLENLPVLIFVIGNNVITGKWEGVHYFPILIHSIFMLVYGIVLQHIFNRKRLSFMN